MLGLVQSTQTFAIMPKPTSSVKMVKSKFEALLKTIDDDMVKHNRNAYTIDQLKHYANHGLTLLNALNDTTFICEEGLRWYDALVLNFQHEMMSRQDLIALLEWYTGWMTRVLSAVEIAESTTREDQVNYEYFHHTTKQLEEQKHRFYTDVQLWAYMLEGLSLLTDMDDTTLALNEGLTWLALLTKSAQQREILNDDQLTDLVLFYSKWVKSVVGLESLSDEDMMDEDAHESQFGHGDYYNDHQEQPRAVQDEYIDHYETSEDLRAFPY